MVGNRMRKDAMQFLVNSSQQNKEIAAIDLGSNSFHMVIARVMNGSIQILSRFKSKVQLAKGLDEDQELSQDAIERGMACLALFAERLQGFEPENVKVVGTYTLRQAKNVDDFIEQAKTVFPYPIEVISGREEARIIYYGVSNTQSEKGRKLVIDIGGGSTEMVIGDNFEPILLESRHMGCVSFARDFFESGKISKVSFKKARREAAERIEDIIWEYRQLGWQSVLGSSGTIKSVSQLMVHNGYKDGLITSARLEELVSRVLKCSSFDELKWLGVSEERFDVFLPGLAILTAIFDGLKIESMRYSNGALREGIMYSLEDSFQVADVQERTVNSLSVQFSIDESQVQRVCDTAMLLFHKYHQWTKIENIEDMRKILYWACWLHEIGISINHYGMHKHSAYIVSNHELPGFNTEQQLLLTMLMRFQVKCFRYLDISELSSYAYDDVLAMIRILRLALIINKSRQATEKTDKFILDINNTKSIWYLEFSPEYLARNPLTHLDLNAETFMLEGLGLGLQVK